MMLKPIFNKAENDNIVKINQDKINDKLFEITDDETSHWSLVCGKYSNPSSESSDSTSNVPSHNNAYESDFGMLDILMRLRPNANVKTF